MLRFECNANWNCYDLYVYQLTDILIKFVHLKLNEMFVVKNIDQLMWNNFEVSIGSKTPVPLGTNNSRPFLSPDGGIYLKLKPITVYLDVAA